MLPVEVAYKVYFDLDGKPLDNGYIYFGEPDQNPITAPVTVYWDSAGTQPAAQPIRTVNGYIVRSGTPANIYISSTYSQIVQDKQSALVYFSPNSDEYSIGQQLTNLSLPTGASFIGGGDQLVAKVNDIRSLLKVSPSKYALVNGPTVTPSIIGSGEYYLDASDTTSADDGFFVIVANDGGRWKRQSLIWQATTKAADSPPLEVRRTTSHIGGTPGYVNSAFKASTEVVDGAVAAYEWTGLFTLDNNATAGENVALYAQSKKHSSGSTWAATFEIQDGYATEPATGASLGIEVTCYANNGDTNQLRNGVNVVAAKLLPGGTDCEWGRGFWASNQTNSRFIDAFSNTAVFKTAAFRNAGDASGFVGSATFKDTGKASLGIDLTGATYTSAAIRLANGQKVSFEPTDTVTLNAGGGLLISAARFQMNQGFSIPSSGNTAATATGGTSGALPAQVNGYLIFKLDGTNYKIPYYGN